ncbi:hypothetical protein [Chitinophaga tropicalis]|uniref:Uncharacterized protein n=1 Tax=Chitinophaga tropicalis TaxID=2683588 RepID=A0A7K1TZZ7_9BACT|nr:hypothetical protein [Chitinophaga tropicalis]MVT07689.1 hypothetical protein [Chitinophaga tropicalis]
MDNSTYSEYCRLQTVLRAVGVGQQADGGLAKAVKTNAPHFQLDYAQHKEGGNRFSFQLAFYQLDGAKPYTLHHLHATLQRPIDIPEVEINGVNSLDLDWRMSKINWNFSERTTNNDNRFITDPQAIQRAVLEVMTDLGTLECAEVGKDVCRRLEAKYFYHSGITNVHPLKDIYEKILKEHSMRHTFYLPEQNCLTFDNLYRAMRTGHLPTIQPAQLPLLEVKVNRLSPYEYIVTNGRVTVSDSLQRYFSSFKNAFEHAQAVDDRHFFPEHVLDKNLDFVICNVNIIDALDKQLMATKRVLWKTEQTPQIRGNQLSWWLQREKIKATDFELQTGYPLTKMKTLDGKPDVYIIDKHALKSSQPLSARYLLRRRPKRKGGHGGL